MTLTQMNRTSLNETETFYLDKSVPTGSMGHWPRPSIILVH